MAELRSLPEMPLAPQRGVLGPLHEPLFRTLWIAAVVSYTGTWMQNVGAAWLMTSLTMSPLMVGLVQAAGSIAVFLVVLPAGAIADMVDRRKLLLFTQSWMVLAAAALGVLTLAGKITPTLLLLLTLLMGFGAVLNDPAWQAITPEIVSHQNFAAGIALNSAGFNVARAIGPALGGLVIAAAGSGIAFLLNAASFFGVIYFLYRWRRRPGRTSFRVAHMMRAMFDGVRHMRGSQSVKAVLVRSAVFSISASALPALLPLLAHPFGSQGYGLLLGFFGLGAFARRCLHAVLPAEGSRPTHWSRLRPRSSPSPHSRERAGRVFRVVGYDVGCRSGVDPDPRQPERFRANHVSGTHAGARHFDVPARTARWSWPAARRCGEKSRNGRACRARSRTPQSGC
jgi:MFS family permease